MSIFVGAFYSLLSMVLYNVISLVNPIPAFRSAGCTTSPGTRKAGVWFMRLQYHKIKTVAIITGFSPPHCTDVL